MVTATLTVLRSMAGTAYAPPGTALPVNLTCGSALDDKATLKTVLLNYSGGAYSEVTAYQSGVIVATKIIDACSNDFAYVTEPINDVAAMQTPCCWQSSFIPGSDDVLIDFDDSPVEDEDEGEILV